ncbi:MAG: glycosyltransferase family 1 protein [Sulfurimonas sp.]|nr:MAG: glycosyltransferase family 1 protein [Sulfurimonas sp.]
MKKIIIITTVPMSIATLIKGQAKYLSQFFEVQLITSYSEINKDIEDYEGVKVKSINMTRKITIFKDLKSLLDIYFFILKEKPEIVYTFTPKAGLLGMIASFFARVPVRVHNIVGMPLMEAKGKKKYLLKFIEKLTYFFSTKLLCNSFGLKNYINKNLTKKDIKIIGNGSINGVDTDYFNDNFNDNDKKNIRLKYNINEKDFILIFVGRIVKDKGINELVEAFVELKKVYNDIKLLLVGDYEKDLNPIKQKNMDLINELEDIIFVGFQDDIREFLAISNIFILPSYREGLPNSLIEAGSCGIPLIATNINGCNEIVINNDTGLLVEKKSMQSLKNAIELLLINSNLYKKIKSKVRGSIIKRYSQKYFLNELRNELEKII